MEDRLENFGGTGSPLVFAHANGYPPGSYRQFLEPLTAQNRVMACRLRPLWGTDAAPLRADWKLFAKDLVQTLEQQALGPVWMMGHSLGAVVSMLAALRSPALFRGLILIDPVFLPTRQSLAQRLAPRQALRKMPLVRKTLQRPSQFLDVKSAFDFHRSKRAFAGLSDSVLWDYIHAGTRPIDGGVERAWSPAWEAAVYSSVPLVWPRIRRLTLPTLGLRGETSDILDEAAMRRWAGLQPTAQLHTLPGGHLLPLEHPADSANCVTEFIARQTD